MKIRIRNIELPASRLIGFSSGVESELDVPDPDLGWKILCAMPGGAISPDGQSVKPIVSVVYIERNQIDWVGPGPTGGMAP